MNNRLDQRFINMAIKIRKDFLKSLKEATQKQEIVNHYLNELNELKNDLDNSKNDEDLVSKLRVIEQKIKAIEKEMSVLVDKRTKLEKEEIQLLEMIKERYPDITENELKEQIYPYIQNLTV